MQLSPWAFGFLAVAFRSTCFSLMKGDFVEAVFDEGEVRNWYPGVVEAVHPDGYDVRWDYPDGGPAVSRVQEVQSYTPARRLAEFLEGSRHRGEVVGMASFGIFVDVGATRDGLVHISCIKGTIEEIRMGQMVDASCPQGEPETWMRCG